MSENQFRCDPRAVVFQMTARRDYAIARALEHGNALSKMATDLAVPAWADKFAKGPFARYQVDLPTDKVKASPLTGLAYRAAMRLAPHAAWPHIWATKTTARASLSTLGNAQPNIVFGLDTTALEIFEYFASRPQRPRFVLEQCVAPRRSQLAMVEKLAPHLTEEEVLTRLNYINAFKPREEREWELADVIISPSSYVSEELIAAGCDVDKIRLVPYGYSPDPNIPPPDSRTHRKPLKGLFVGGVDLRKGVHDLAAVAADFKDEIHFDVYGKHLAEAEHIDEWRPSLDLHGPHPFDTIKHAYQEADFLVLPSYLEGSAMVVYEAMAYGLPCIVTRETGSIVEDGVSGFVVHAGDRAELARVFRTLLNDQSLLDTMSIAARKAAGTVSDDSYSDRLMEAVLS